MSPFPIQAWDDRLYKTTEALFQAMRFGLGSPEAELVRAEGSPMGAKMKARSLGGHRVVVPLSTQDLQNMQKCLEIKLEQHPHLVPQLMETGDRLIVEDCTRRQAGSGLFWGAAWDGTNWNGKNWLGRLWMDLRS